ncbi:Lar family restriction alleviation protein, partial [Candidatus Saccharibacteria bacterium]|nr:Lar family restriction alleviation protein [Candidatus Saccharibacteria bacterium]
GAFYLSNYIRYQETLISVGFNSLATKELVGNKFENPELLEPEVKPCPFCGGKADVLENAWGYYINCSKCRKGDSCLSGFYEKQEAIEAWNKRV